MRSDMRSAAYPITWLTTPVLTTASGVVASKVRSGKYDITQKLTTTVIFLVFCITWHFGCQVASNQHIGWTFVLDANDIVRSCCVIMTDHI